MNQKSYLQVVNASAGSGKTYSLVKTYIHLLLTDEGENAANKYAEILAMTFTNKAALEMKTRIIKALDELANPEVYEESDYINTIASETGLKADEVQIKSKRLLSGILHRYEDFHVMTIDKFNLRLIRSFSRDLDLPSDFEVVLNEVPVIEQVVDGILEEIGKNKELSEILLHYANANIEDEKSWDLRKSLIEFGKVLSSEQDLPYVERLMNMEFSIEDHKKHRLELQELNEEYQRKSKELAALFNAFGFTEKDFSRGGNIVKAIEKFAVGTLKLSDKFPLTPTNLTNIEKTAETNSSAVELNGIATKLTEWYEVNSEYAGVLSIYLKNYFNMALLKYMNSSLLALNKQERLIRISEFNTKIAELLQEDTLYIYEKLGTRFRHFMLDEFQDTSRLQWLNLIPLIRESLGNGQKNFIVGDPKQAIYRFKNGVAEQFVELPRVYNPEQDAKIAEVSTYFQQMGRVDVLEDNWRSAAEIVKFNNELFDQLSIKLNNQQKDFYAAVKQNPKSKKNGYVYVESKPVGKNSNQDEKKDDQFRFVLSAVQDAINDGFKPGDICILGRGNKFCNFIATALTNEKYKVVSADSLNIDSELTVRFVISYFKLRLNPVNQNIIRQFAHVYCERFNHSLDYYNSLFTRVELNDQKTIKTANLDLFFSKNPQYKDHFFEPFETLYDLVQKTLRLFGLDELKNPYLHHLADLIHSFETRNGPDLNQFLQDYDSMPKDAKALQIPESDDALRVMTIHKSKGLEFPVVIVINDMDSKVKGEFFIETEKYLLRNTLAKESPVQEIREASEEEQSKVYLDTLNLYYVAYTRPVNRLYVKNDYATSGLSAEIHQILKQIPDTIEDGQEIRFIRGEKRLHQQTEKQPTDDFFTPKSSTDNLWFPDIALQDSDDLKTEDFLSDEQRYGNQFHLAISSIHAKNEIETILRQFIQTGEIEQAFEEQLKQDLKKLFETESYNQLFESAVDILSEQSVIISRNEQIRPDKIIVKSDKTVVLDYKTGQPSKKHIKQLEQYRSVLQKMNYPSVEAHLFYIKNFQLVKVGN
jgi:ATP-dependent exoDNAse (exonuclease V) beta subunit